MAAEQTITLLDRLRQCELLDRAQLEELSALPESLDPDPRVLGRVLVQRDWLTRFQISLVARGRGKDLAIGPYVLLDRLGEGGMGEVFQARHRHMQRIVALKLIRKEKLASDEAVKRFYREVQAAAQLHHANIVVAYDAGPAGNTHYFAMEYVEGSDLARLVRDSGPLPSGQACDFVRQAALGLQHAYERGLVHRDIKPANLFVSWDADGNATVKILDMGLARILAVGVEEKALTRTGQVMGTPDYLAPEQALDAHTADIRADLYSLGCTLYFLLAGRPPFTGESLAQVLLKHQMAEPEVPEGGWGSIPTGVRAVLRKLLAKDPADRYQTPQELAAALSPLCGGTGVVARGGGAASQGSVPSDTGWPTLAGEEGDKARQRSVRRRTGDSTSQAPSKKKTSLSNPATGSRKLWLIAGGIGLGVLLLLALVIGLVRRQKQDNRPADSLASPSAKQSLQAELPQVIATRLEDLSLADNPTPPAAPPQPTTIGVVSGTASSPAQVPASRPTSPPAAKPLSRPSGQSPLDLLDPTRVTAQQRQSLPASLPIVALLPRHTDAILGVVFSPDGKQLVTTSRDGNLRVWDLWGAEPKNILEFNNPGGALGAPTYSADGKSLAVATRTSLLWYNTSGPFPLLRHTLPSCTLSPGDGPKPFPEQVLAFFPDGKLLLAAGLQSVPYSTDRSVRGIVNFWRLNQDIPPPPTTVPLQPAAIHSLAVAPDHLVASGGDAKALQTRFFDRMGKSQGGGGGYSPIGDAIVGMNFSPDGSSLATTTKDGWVVLYHDVIRNGASARLGGVAKTKGHEGWATVLGFTPDGQTFMTRGEDRYVAWWSTSGKEKDRLREWQLPEGCDLWRFSPDGWYAAVGLPDEGIAIIRLPAPFQQP